MWVGLTSSIDFKFMLIFPCQQRDNTNTQSYLVSFATWVRIYRHKVTLPVLLGRILEKESITSSLKKLNLHATFHLYTKTNNILVQNCRRIAIVQYNTDKLIWLWRERKKQKNKTELIFFSVCCTIRRNKLFN